MLWLTLLLACGAPAPVVDTVDPASGRPGQPLKILGSNFVEGAKATLGGAAVGDLAFKGPVLIEGTIPQLAPGKHALVLTNPDGAAATLADAVTIAEPPPPDRICDPGYTAYVQLAAGRRLIKQDRHHTGSDEVESLQIDFDDITSVLYEGRKQGDAYCSAILLDLTSGKRMVYEDSKELDLRRKAQELSQIVKRPFEVVAEEPRL